MRNSLTEWIGALNSHRMCVELFYFAILCYCLTQFLGRAPTFLKNCDDKPTNESNRIMRCDTEQLALFSGAVTFWISYFKSFNFSLFCDFFLDFSEYFVFYLVHSFSMLHQFFRRNEFCTFSITNQLPRNDFCLRSKRIVKPSTKKLRFSFVLSHVCCTIHIPRTMSCVFVSLYFPHIYAHRTIITYMIFRMENSM